MSSLPRTGDQEDANKPQGYIIRTSTYSGALPMGDTDWTSLSSSPYTFQRAKSFSQKKEKDNTPSPYHAKILQNRSNTSEEMTLEQQAAQSKRCQRCFKTKKEDPSWGHLTQKELSVRVFCIIRTQWTASSVILLNPHFLPRATLFLFFIFSVPSQATWAECRSHLNKDTPSNALSIYTQRARGHGTKDLLYQALYPEVYNLYSTTVWGSRGGFFSNHWASAEENASVNCNNGQGPFLDCPSNLIKGLVPLLPHPLICPPDRPGTCYSTTWPQLNDHSILPELLS
jgi:hypothetical protein